MAPGSSIRRGRAASPASAACTLALVAAVAAWPLAAGCKGAGLEREVSIRFVAELPGGRAFDCNASEEEGRTRLGDLRFFVHDLRLVDASGKEHPLRIVEGGAWQRGGVALIDLENGSGLCRRGTAETNDTVRGLVASRDYEALRFRIGVPASARRAGLDSLEAATSMRGDDGDYDHLRLVALTGGVRWELRLRSTGCGDGDACEHPNRPELDVRNFSPDRDEVSFDLTRLFRDLDLQGKDEGRSPPGCAGDPDDPGCRAVLRNLGLDPRGVVATRGRVFVSRLQQRLRR